MSPDNQAAPARLPLVPVSWGELIDKITILEIKRVRLETAEARANVGRELAALTSVRDVGEPPPELAALTDDLRAVNAALWDIEDAIRDCERRQTFDARFIELARAVYHSNDRRAELKRRINRLLASALVEEKSYRPY
jgi:hypothetical protein